MRTPGRALLAGGLAGAALLAYLVLWLQVDPFHIGRSDFTSTYVGATLLRQGQGPSMYDESLQKPLHDLLIAPDHEGNLPFVNAPLAAVVALPVSFLSLDTAYRLWSLLQLAMVVAASAIAVRSAPGRQGLDRRRLAACGLVAVAGLGTWSLLMLGQWDGLSALGLAGAYAALRRGRPSTAGALLAVTSLVAKPHLALGLAAFVLGRRDRRLLAGAAGGTLVAVGLSAVAVGPAAVAGFAGAAVHSTGRWELRQMVSLIGITGSLAGDGGLAQVLGAAGSLVCLVVAFRLGASVRQAPARLDAALAGAAVLSLLASPHAYPHDLALLVPVAAWCLVAATAQAGGARPRVPVLGLWVAVNLAAEAGLALGAALAPWALLAAAGASVVTCRRIGTGARSGAAAAHHPAPEPVPGAA